jgi:hypothetical protein
MLTKKKKQLYACDLNFFFSHKNKKFQETKWAFEKRTKKMSIFEKPKYFLEFFIFFERKKTFIFFDFFGFFGFILDINK